MSQAGERLAALRGELRRQGADGFVLPRTDMFGSEYLPPADERVAWLTGFTGSAARVIVLADTAAVFTDGRYTLQVRAQVSGELYQTPHLIDEPPADWLKVNVQKGARVGYDPMLHLRGDVERLAKACAAREAELVPLALNPVDAVWTDRPAPPVTPIAAHPLAHAGESSVDKRKRMLAKAQAAGGDALFVSAPDAIAWLLNIRGHDISFNPLCLGLALVVAGGRTVLLTDPRKRPDGFVFEDTLIGLHDLADRRTLYADLAHDNLQVLVDPATTHLGLIDELEAAGLCVVEGADPIARAKALKNEAEIEGARRAQRVDGVAVTRFLSWLDRQNQTDEFTAAAALEAERAKDASYRGPSFDTISGAGPNGAIVHYRASETTNRPLESGSLYLVDSGGQYADATTDITRTIAVGEPTTEMRRRYTLVLKGHIALATAVFPEGTSGSQLDAFARRPLWEAGIDYDHGTGHGIGSYLCVHEGPQRFSKRGGDAKLEPGMILSNEPGCYVEGEYGIRLENLILVVEKDTPADGDRPMLGFETLTLAPFDRRLIDVELLTDAERTWVDAYHAAVREALSPLVDAATATWLDAATSSL